VLPQLSLPDSIQRKLREMTAEPISYVYRTDELGAFESLLNQSEVRLELLKQFAVLEDEFSEQADRDQFSAVLAPFKQVILSDAGIEQLVAKELNFFHLLYGMGMDSGEHFYYDEQYPNLIGGNPILGKGHLYQTLVDTAEGRFTVVNEVVTDPKSTKEFMKQAIPVLLPNMKDSKDFKKVFKNSRMQISDRQVYDFYYGYYLPHIITTERRTEIFLPNEKRVQIEQLNLYLVYD
jgi:hypothetical protein